MATCRPHEPNLGDAAMVVAILAIAATAAVGATTWWSLGFLVGLLLAGVACILWAWGKRRDLLSRQWARVDAATVGGWVLLYVALTGGLLLGETVGTVAGVLFGIVGAAAGAFIGIVEHGERMARARTQPDSYFRGSERELPDQLSREPRHAKECVACRPAVPPRGEDGRAIPPGGTDCPCLEDPENACLACRVESMQLKPADADDEEEDDDPGMGWPGEEGQRGPHPQ